MLLDAGQPLGSGAAGVLHGNRTPVNTLCTGPLSPSHHFPAHKQQETKPREARLAGGGEHGPHQGPRPGTVTHISPPSPSRGGFCDSTLLRTQAPPSALLRFFVFCIWLGHCRSGAHACMCALRLAGLSQTGCSCVPPLSQPGFRCPPTPGLGLEGTQ